MPDEARRSQSGESMQIVGITLRVRSSDESEVDVELTDVPDLDALFWNLEAVQKFLLPYYVVNHGIDRARQEWDAAVDQQNRYGFTLVKHKLLCKVHVPALDLRGQPARW
jgi:hypothetical protein